MDKGGVLFFLIFIIGICYIIYASIPSKYTKSRGKLWWIFE